MLCHGPRGAFFHRSGYAQQAFKPALERLGIDSRFRFHDLRHSHAAHLIKQSAHVKAIQMRLGHSQITTTLDTYGHLLPGIDSDIVAGLDTEWSEAGSDELDRPR